MLKVSENGVIKLTRGDTAKFEVQIHNDLTGTPYELSSDDILFMTVKYYVGDEIPVIQKRNEGIADFVLLPEDTKNLSFGKYIYDVELRSGDDVYTVIPPTVFEILEEVTQ